MTFLKALKEAALFFVPRFLNEDVAVEKQRDGTYLTVCSMSDVQPDEKFDGVIHITSFVFMFWGFPVKSGNQNIEVQPWPTTP